MPFLYGIFPRISLHTKGHTTFPLLHNLSNFHQCLFFVLVHNVHIAHLNVELVPVLSFPVLSFIFWKTKHRVEHQKPVSSKKCSKRTAGVILRPSLRYSRKLSCCSWLLVPCYLLNPKMLKVLHYC